MWAVFQISCTDRQRFEEREKRVEANQDYVLRALKEYIERSTPRPSVEYRADPNATQAAIAREMLRFVNKSELRTLAPRSKYPTQYTHPNGMATVYTYDSVGRPTSVDHKDGSTVKQGFTYAYDDFFNITRTTHEDGSYWDYTYDDRY